jgi:hypothetical protein
MFIICRECGAALGEDEIEQASHECVFEQMIAFQTQCARLEIERRLAAEVALWERDPHLSRRLEFARYLRDRGERRAADVTRNRRPRTRLGQT